MEMSLVLIMLLSPGRSVMLHVPGKMWPRGDGSPGFVLDLNMVGQVSDLKFLVKQKGYAGVWCAMEMALFSGEELRRAREELLDVILAQGGRHDCWSMITDDSHPDPSTGFAKEMGNRRR